MSSLGQPELTVTVIAVGSHMVWNPASHLSLLLIDGLPAGF